MSTGFRFTMKKNEKRTDGRLSPAGQFGSHGPFSTAPLHLYERFAGCDPVVRRNAIGTRHVLVGNEGACGNGHCFGGNLRQLDIGADVIGIGCGSGTA